MTRKQIRTDEIRCLVGAANLLLDKQHFQVAALLTSQIALTLIGSIGNPLALKLLFDEAIIKHRFPRFIELAIALVLLFALVRVASGFLRVWFYAKRNTVIELTSLRMLATYYRLPFKEVLLRDSGYFSARILDDTSATATLVLDLLISACTGIVGFIASAVVIIMLSWKASLVLLALIPVIILLTRRFGRGISMAAHSEREQEARVRGNVGRAVDAYKSVVVYKLQQIVARTIRVHLTGYLDAVQSKLKRSTLYETASGISMSFGEAAVTIVGGYAILGGSLSFGGFMAFMNSFWNVMNSANQLIDMVPSIITASAGLERMVQFDEMQDRISSTDADHGDIVFEGVWFSYGAEEVFRDLTFTIHLGDRIAISGPNGAGKSTLAHLIAGLLRPDRGSVRTAPVGRVNLVTDPWPFPPGPICEYLSRAEDGALLPNVQVMGSALKVLDLIDKDAEKLSAGQKKKLQILIALSREASIYIFDEPLSHVDEEAKQVIMDLIAEKTVGKTLIAILHGPQQYAKYFDRVIDMARLTQHASQQLTVPA